MSGFECGTRSQIRLMHKQTNDGEQGKKIAVQRFVVLN